MSQARIRGGVAGLVTLGVFASILFLALRGGPRVSGEPDGKPAARPAGAPIKMPKDSGHLIIVLGEKDQKPTTWDGSLELSEGKILSAKINRGNAKGKVVNNQFAVKSVFGMKKEGGLVSPELAVAVAAPATAKLTVKTEQGEFVVTLGELQAGVAKKFLDEQASVTREEGSLRLTDDVAEDDYPVLAKAPDGKIWLAYNEYQKDKEPIKERVFAGNFDLLVPTSNGDQIRMKHFDGETWSPTIDVTDTGLVIWRPTIAVDGKGVVHIAWSEQIDDNWDIYHRTYTPGKKGNGEFSKIERLTKDPDADFHVVSTTDADGNVWLAWQAHRDGFFQILTAQVGKATVAITKGNTNSWTPAIAADSKGNVYVAYDTYENENYDVRLHITGKGNGSTINVADSARFEARPAIVCDGADRVWIAYEYGDEQWGQDYSTNMFRKIGLDDNPGYGLYINRTIKVQCLADGKLLQPASDLEKAFGERLRNNKSVPRLAVDAKNAVWLLLRHHPLSSGAGEVWNSFAMRFDGKDWSEPRRLADSENLLDNRPALVGLGDDMLSVFSGDERTSSQKRGQCDLFATVLRLPGDIEKEPQLIPAEPTPKAEMKPVHANERENVARIRDYRIEHQGKKLHLLRGEFHRHTEFTAHRDGDGLLEDAWRYALDAARHDWMGDGDHDNGYGHEYPWWQIQKMTDLYYHTPHFVSVHSYERSNVYPNGHRNAILPMRGVRPLMRGNLKGDPELGTPDTKLFYAYLRHFGGMCASHTSGTNMGTDWRDNDPVVEPVVEIYQGHRHNYEHYGAPRSATADTQIGGYQPKGFIWNAFEKGYKLGFQASSDHISTHMSYAVVLTDDVSRKGLIDDFKRRHSYAATDNIILEVRSGQQLMGDIFTTAKRPTLDIRVHGTAPITKLHVVRDSKYVFSTEPNKEVVSATYTDADIEPDTTAMYYVRVEQRDGNIAWASPMWITYKAE